MNSNLLQAQTVNEAELTEDEERRSPSGDSSTSIVFSGNDSTANISNMVTYHSTLTIKRGDRTVPTKSTQLRESDPELYDKSSLVKTEAFRIEVLSELDEDEERDRHRLELRVEQAFYQAGAALRELRDRRLYRSTHHTFEQYCQDRFSYHRRHSYQLIDAAVVFENLCAIGAQKNSDTSGARILPTSERQCRPLTRLEPAQQVVAWQQAVESAGGKAPSGRAVKGIVEQLKEKPRLHAADFCCIGDVFVLTKLEDSDRKYNGCPCVAVELKQFSVDVDVHDTTLTVKPENLKKVDSPDAYHQLPQILKRIRRLRQVDSLDRSVIYFLEGVGRQIYLTEVEDMLLSCLEEHYEIK